MRTFLALIIPIAVIAQEGTVQTENKTEIISQLRLVGFMGAAYLEGHNEDTQVLIKQRTPKSENPEDRPTGENQFDRLPVLQFNTGLGFRNFSPHSMRYTDKNGNSGPYGQITGKGNTGYYGRESLVADLGASFRVPTSGPLRRLSTGGFLSLSESLCRYTSYNEPGSDTCTKGLKDLLFNSWTVFSEYDVLIFKRNGSNSISIGGYYQSIPVSHGTEVSSNDDNSARIYQKNKEFGGVVRYRILESEGNRAFPRWELSLYVGQGGTIRGTIGVNLPMLKRRINPPVRVNK